MMVPGEDAEMMAYSHGLLNEAMNDKGKCNIPEFEPEVLWYEHSKSLCVQSHPEWNPKSGADYFFKLVDLVK
jgi:hypothetical protein